MDWNEVGIWASVAVLIAALFLFPRWFSARRRAMSGVILFALGWAGIFGSLALDNQAFMQSEVVAWFWMGTSAIAVVLAITLLVPLLFEWRRMRRRNRRKKERWPAGHQNG